VWQQEGGIATPHRRTPANVRCPTRGASLPTYGCFVQTTGALARISNAPMAELQLALVEPNVHDLGFFELNGRLRMLTFSVVRSRQDIAEHPATRGSAVWGHLFPGAAFPGSIVSEDAGDGSISTGNCPDARLNVQQLQRLFVRAAKGGRKARSLSRPALANPPRKPLMMLQWGCPRWRIKATSRVPKRGSCSEFAASESEAAVFSGTLPAPAAQMRSPPPGHSRPKRNCAAHAHLFG
jgi:hypothetical protein